MPGSPALRGWRQKDREFKIILSPRARFLILFCFGDRAHITQRGALTYIVESDLKFLILLPLLHECLDHNWEPAVTGIKPLASYKPGQYATGYQLSYSPRSTRGHASGKQNNNKGVCFLRCLPLHLLQESEIITVYLFRKFYIPISF